MSALQDAAQAIWDSELGKDATYTPPGGATVSCRVLEHRLIIPQSDWEEVTHVRLEYKFRLAEVSPVRNGTLVVDGTSYSLKELVYNDALTSWWAVKPN